MAVTLVKCCHCVCCRLKTLWYTFASFHNRMEIEVSMSKFSEFFFVSHFLTASRLVAHFELFYYSRNYYVKKHSKCSHFDTSSNPVRVQENDFISSANIVLVLLLILLT